MTTPQNAIIFFYWNLLQKAFKMFSLGYSLEKEYIVYMSDTGPVGLLFRK